MNSNKTLKILEGLTRKDLNGFFEYGINCSECNPQHRKILNYLIKRRDSTIEKLSQETNIKTQRIPKLMAEIQKILESWIVYEKEKCKTTEIRKYEVLLSYYSDNNLYKYAESIIKKIDSIEMSSLSAIEYQDLYYARKTIDRVSKYYSKVEKVSSSFSYLYLLDTYHAIEKIKMLCEAVNRTNILGANTLPSEYKVESKLHTESILLQCYILIYRLICRKESFNFNNQNFLKEKIDLLSSREELRGDLFTIIHYGINLYLLEIKANQKKSNRENLFQFVNFLIDKNLFVEDNLLDSSLFKICVTNSIRLGMTEWAEHFIDNYSKYLPIESRTNNILFFKSIVLYAQNKFDELKLSTRKLSHDQLNIFQRIEIQRILLKICVEEQRVCDCNFAKNDNYTKSLLKNHQSMITKSTIGDNHKMLSLNFIKNCKKILADPSSILILPTAEREWLEGIIKK